MISLLNVEQLVSHNVNSACRQADAVSYIVAFLTQTEDSTAIKKSELDRDVFAQEKAIFFVRNISQVTKLLNIRSFINIFIRL